MKKNMRILVVSAVMMLGTTTVQAQFGNLVGNLKKVKETVEDVNKKRNGDIEFTRGGTVQGFFRTRTGEFILDKTHPDGERKGKKVIFKVEKNGDVMYDDGRKVGEVLKDGTVNFHGEQGYLKVQGDGSVMMDGEKVATHRHCQGSRQEVCGIALFGHLSQQGVAGQVEGRIGRGEAQAGGRGQTSAGTCRTA